MDADALDRFSRATAAWFGANFAAPTPVQAQAWAAIARGDHTLVVAPTGSGKTLAAFLWAIDRLAQAPEASGCRVLYVSPLKALAVDVERNLRSPLVGIGHAATRLGLPRPEITTAIRSGDTPADERRRFAKAPADILITTPESLFLLLTSGAREALRGVETVIVDEIHAVAGTKRGAHLAVSLDRLDALAPRPAQRIGLSATVRPVSEVARFLAGGRPTTIVDPPTDKRWQLDVVVPVPDLASLGEPTGDLSGPAAGDPRRASIWPHVEERIVDLIEAHSSTLVFANSRRLAERLTARLNDIAVGRADAVDAEAAARASATHEAQVRWLGGPLQTRAPRRPPAEVMAQSGVATGGPPVLARAHHGSVSREQRAQTEDDLKAGRLPAVVATSSLELGIDMGAVDLVVQVEAPPSVASGLQRVGRAGHQVGATSHGVFFPKFRGDLVASAVIVERMRAGEIEELRVPSQPLDVLAQQIVAMVALDDWTVDDLHALVRRSAPFAALGRAVLESVLDMLSGRYPSEEFAELRPRLVWDRVAGTLVGRRGAQRIAVTSGGTIPDRGLYGVFVAGEGPGRRVGELDEEMVYESRVGDVITLGTTSWRIEDITHDQVLVTPAPGEPGRLPFWKGDTLGRPAELGAAVGAFVREVGGLAPDAARARLGAAGLDAWASDNLLAYLTEQREATGRLPHDRQIVVERFTDELGDWRLVIHTPYGAGVHAPWALAIGARLRERHGVDVAAMHSDDGIVLRLPDLGDDAPDTWLADLLLDPDEVSALVTEQIGGSALFASRFRECAGRALLLPRRHPGRRQPLWQQRQRSAQLLQVAAQYPSFPIVLEAVREVLQDVFDLPALVELMRRVRSREVGVVEVRTPAPSPFAQSLLFGYVAQFMYEGDSPLAERRAAALTLDPDLLAELLGTSDGLSLRDLLDPAALARTEAELQYLVASRHARDPDDLTDLLRVLGPLSGDELAARSSGFDPAWVERLAASGRIYAAGFGGEVRWAAIEDAGRLRDALGVAMPLGVPDAFAAVTADPLGDLLLRWARSHGPFTAASVAARYGLGPAVAADALRRLLADGRLVEGEFTPGASGLEFCDPGVLRTIRRRSVAALRAEVEPVPQADFARFLGAWAGLGSEAGGAGERRPALSGPDGVLRAVEQLAGVVLPASAVESLILPARVRGYAPALLDELCAAGEVVWRGHGELAGRDGWVSFAPAELAGLLGSGGPGAPEGPLDAALLDALGDGGAYFFGALEARVRARAEATTREIADALWSLVWRGLVTNDTLTPLRARLSAGTTTVRARRPAPRGRYGSLRLPRPVVPADVAGRWSLFPVPEATPTERLVVTSEVLLDRYGVVTRGSVGAEDIAGGFAAVYRTLSASEEAGRVRRGYFVEGLGAAQFAPVGAIDRLRSAPAQPAVALAASDPAQPYGAALPWPATPGSHKPARKAGALVVLREGEPVVYLERGGRTALVWSRDPAALADAAAALAGLVRAGRLASLTVDKIDGEPVLGPRHPFADALAAAGFTLTPKGLRLRR